MAIANKGKTAVPAKPQRVSANPASFTQGGLIDDVDVEFIEVGTTMYDYNGSQPEGPALGIQMLDSNGATHDQYFSAGKPDDWALDDDNEGFVPLSGKTGINNSTNLGKFIQSLVDAGFPAEMLDDGNYKVLQGLNCHVNQVTVERKGLVRTGKNADRPSTVLLVSKINAMPGTAGKTAGTGKVAPKAAAAVSGKANGAAKPAPAATSADQIDEEIATALTMALADGPLAKKDAVQAVFNHFDGDPELKPLRNKAVARCGQAPYLKGLAERNIIFDGSNLEMAA
jgi:hypothetical protein